MKTIAQSIVKVNNDVFDGGVKRRNEDSWFHKDNFVAVSDGAGGVGLLADKWSELLVSKVPKKPFAGTDAIDKWIGGFWEDFYNKHSVELMDDPWKISKFEGEGSLATLSVLWETGKNNFVYQSYGDTVLFVYNTVNGELRIQENVQTVNYFGVSPALLNWKTETHDKELFFEQKLKLKKNEVFILATDGIAMYIYGVYCSFKNNIEKKISEQKMRKILAYFNKYPIKDFKEWMNILKESLTSEKAFSSLMNDWYNNKALPNDDYTLVWIMRE